MSLACVFGSPSIVSGAAAAQPSSGIVSGVSAAPARSASPNATGAAATGLAANPATTVTITLTIRMRRTSPPLWDEVTIEHTLGDLADLHTIVHCLRLDEAPGALLVELVVVHQPTLRTIDELARFEPLFEVNDIALQGCQLRVSGERHLDRGNEIALLERLHEIRKRARVARLLDEVALRERREDEHCGKALPSDVTCRRQAVEPRHLHVEDGEIGDELTHQLDGFVAATRLTYHRVALFFEELLE